MNEVAVKFEDYDEADTKIYIKEEDILWQENDVMSTSEEMNPSQHASSHEQDNVPLTQPEFITAYHNKENAGATQDCSSSCLNAGLTLDLLEGTEEIERPRKKSKIVHQLNPKLMLQTLMDSKNKTLSSIKKSKLDCLVEGKTKMGLSDQKNCLLLPPLQGLLHIPMVFFVYLEFIDLVDQIDKVKIPRVIPRDRQNPFTCISEEDFVDCYRLSPACTLQLLDNVQPLLPKARNGRGCSVPAHLQLLAALRYFASGSYQLTMADSLEMSASSICKFVYRIAVILAHMSPNYIKFPKTADAYQVAEDFYAVAGMPGVIGCIGGTLIPVVSPGGNTAELYRCRKGSFALNVMAVCDAKKRFTNVISSWPGSFHDSHIFCNSRLSKKLEDESYSGYLLGNSGYPCKSYLLTPVMDPQTEQESRYNASHKHTYSSTIQRCFGMLKRRFAALRQLRTKLETSKKIIIAAAVLHNIAVDSGVPAPENIPEPVEVHDYVHPETAAGKALRLRIIEQWF